MHLLGSWQILVGIAVTKQTQLLTEWPGAGSNRRPSDFQAQTFAQVTAYVSVRRTIPERFGERPESGDRHQVDPHGGRLGHRLAALPEQLHVQPDGLAHLGRGLFRGVAERDTAGQLRGPRAVAVVGPFDHHRVTVNVRSHH